MPLAPFFIFETKKVQPDDLFGGEVLGDRELREAGVRCTARSRRKPRRKTANHITHLSLLDWK